MHYVAEDGLELPSTGITDTHLYAWLNCFKESGEEYFNKGFMLA